MFDQKLLSTGLSQVTVCCTCNTCLAAAAAASDETVLLTLSTVDRSRDSD